MNVAVVYCYPVVAGREYFPRAKRFAETYRQFPARAEHTLYLGLNGQVMGPNQLTPFQHLPHQVIHHDNSGWDIGLYQKAADHIPCDLLVCLGGYTHFHYAGWLEKMIEAYLNHGPALYGCWGMPHPSVHIRTTAFWLPRELLQSYPDFIGSDRRGRYAFEHGPKSMTAHVREHGFEVWMVTRNGCFLPAQWKEIHFGLNESLVCDQFTHATDSRIDR